MTIEQADMIRNLKKRLQIHAINTSYKVFTPGTKRSIAFVFTYSVKVPALERTFKRFNKATLGADWANVIRLYSADIVYQKHYYDRLCADIAKELKTGQREYYIHSLPEVPA